jgi:hypothetical protein
LLRDALNYGTNTFLAPNEDGKVIQCGDVKIEIRGGILIDRQKLVHAFAGLPYFPAIVSLPLPELGDLSVWYSNIPDENICAVNDLILQNKQISLSRTPKEIWKSKLVENGGIKRLGCLYRFRKDLQESQDYVIQFRDGFLGCAIPEIPLEIKKKGGYHQVLVQ